VSFLFEQHLVVEFPAGFETLLTGALNRRRTYTCVRTAGTGVETKDAVGSLAMTRVQGAFSHFRQFHFYRIIT
jgi:hypothetical protein